MVFSEQLFAIISNDNRILVNMLIFYSNIAFQFQHYVKRVCVQQPPKSCHLALLLTSTESNWNG